MELAPAFWFLGDDTSKLGKNPDLYPQFRAALLHALLYDARVVLSDSYAVNNRNFRRAASEDSTLRHLIELGLVRLAGRIIGRKPLPLIALRDQFIERGHQPPAFPLEEYKQSMELEFLDEQAKVYPYALDSLATRFTEDICMLLQSEETRNVFGDDVSEILNLLIAERIEAEVDNKLRLAYFWYPDQIGADLIQRLGDPYAWKRYGDKLRNIVQGPYLTGLPSVINANPIYTNDHRLSIDIFRRREKLGSQVIGDAVQFNSWIDIACYVAALEKITVEHILKLRSTPEWEAYQMTLNSGVSSERDSKELINAYLAYRRQIELLMIHEVLHTTPQKNVNMGNISSSIMMSSGGVALWLAQEIVDLMSGSIIGKMLGLCRAILKPFRSTLKDPSRVVARQEDHVVDIARINLDQQERENPKGVIESKLTVYGPNVRDTCVTVKYGNE